MLALLNPFFLQIVLLGWVLAADPWFFPPCILVSPGRSVGRSPCL